ncbi:hypothetical protein HELRODRAFT_175357 [Helobdella robusta]|uniref:Fucolectin tachylectin-4 pentraxin-1 domain-containing protein n=1 Tax=Helobdella robusta TaxID=6412 RepID=T1F968_HELRO|nr:hypothetical protein HELRODRAFT_175357 [Helobdella robusta]ESO00862.1 hypothetical protein HELRODRAFT_175357 [Helobdella robusta]
MEGESLLANVALGKYTYNSSAFHYSSQIILTSFYAVDGNNDMSDDSSVNCSLTAPGFEPHWIGVDLGTVFSIIYVMLYVGMDHVDLPTKNDLNFFIVGVSNRSLDVHPPVGGTYDLCAQYPGVVAPKQVVQLNCSSSTPPARYVILQQPSNSTGYMSVCEFEVYGTPYESLIKIERRRNLLLKRPANSSSSLYASDVCGPLLAKMAVDGFHDTFRYNCHCAITSDIPGGPNWYTFDMQTSYRIDYIALTARSYEG